MRARRGSSPRGARCEIGLVYEFALTDEDDDIMDKRITFDFAVRF